MGRMNHPKEPKRNIKKFKREVKIMEKKRIRTGFKVCRCIGYYEIVSAFPSLGHSKNYNIGGWTRRPNNCGPLALFDRLQDAEAFLDRESGEPRLTIFLCEYVESDEHQLYTEYGRAHIVPYGTVFADEIKLIKRMYKD